MEDPIGVVNNGYSSGVHEEKRATLLVTAVSLMSLNVLFWIAFH